MRACEIRRSRNSLQICGRTMANRLCYFTIIDDATCAYGLKKVEYGAELVSACRCSRIRGHSDTRRGGEKNNETF